MKMCKICCLPAATRAKIDALLVEGVTYRRIVARFSTKLRPLNVVNLCRHRKHLLPADLVRKPPGPKPEVARSLLERVEELVRRFERVAMRAESDSQYVATTNALKEIHACLRTVGQLTGELNTINFNFLNFAQLTEQQIITFLDALAAGPELAVAHIRTLVLARLGPPTPHINYNVHFVASDGDGHPALNQYSLPGIGESADS